MSHQKSKVYAVVRPHKTYVYTFVCFNAQLPIFWNRKVAHKYAEDFKANVIEIEIPKHPIRGK